MGKGKGFGKTILIGDQFVLHGVPAILSAIPYTTDCEVSLIPNSQGWSLTDNRTEIPGYKDAKHAASIVSFNKMIEIMGLDLSRHELNINVGGNLIAGSGIGASAAICVAFARACNDEFNLGMDNLKINQVAWHGEFGYHGLPSGLDNTVSTFGGAILYQIKNGEKYFSRVKLDNPLEIVLIQSGVTADTAALKGFLEQQKLQNPKLFNRHLREIEVQVKELKDALENSNYQLVGEIMNHNHKILIEMNLSHPKIVELSKDALRLGAYGAKVTGGGRGGYLIALTPGEELQNRVANYFKKMEISVLKATIGNPPLDKTTHQKLI